MLNSLKTSVTILFGLLLGCLVAIPLAWYGSRLGADSLMRNIWIRVTAVQDRQQAMADEALTLQPMLQHFGAFANGTVFRDVENERSLLAGDDTLQGKMVHVQRLEEALLRSERVWAESGARKPALAAWEPFQAYGRVWEEQQRFLVREEDGLGASVDQFNGMLARWPFSVLLAHNTFAGMTDHLLGDAWANTLFLARVGLDWVGYGLRRLAALVGHQAPPPPPAWIWKHPIHPPSGARYVDALPRLIFLADAPLPEDDYKEIQFTQSVRANYADVELGSDKAVLENRNAPAAYGAPQPQPQRTVTYSAPN